MAFDGVTLATRMCAVANTSDCQHSISVFLAQVVEQLWGKSASLDNSWRAMCRRLQAIKPGPAAHAHVAVLLSTDPHIRGIGK
eukprot:115925-Amphidinium_carterae.1